MVNVYGAVIIAVMRVFSSSDECRLSAR